VTGLPIIGMGGVSCGSDVAEMMIAGANAVGIGTVLFGDPTAPVRILREIEEWCRKHNVDNLANITGSVAAN